MNLDALLQRVPPALLLGALEQKALFLVIQDRPYAAVREEWGWWVYELVSGSEEYAVQKDLSSCTCPAGGQCKHVMALKYGAVDTTKIPFPSRKVRR